MNLPVTIHEGYLYPIKMAAIFRDYVIIDFWRLSFCLHFRANRRLRCVYSDLFKWKFVRQQWVVFKIHMYSLVIIHEGSLYHISNECTDYRMSLLLIGDYCFVFIIEQIEGLCLHFYLFKWKFKGYQRCRAKTTVRWWPGVTLSFLANTVECAQSYSYCFSYSNEKSEVLGFGSARAV